MVSYVGIRNNLKVRMARFNHPVPFSLKPNEWPEWLDEFVRFRITTKIRKGEGDVQRDSLLYANRDNKKTIFRTLTFVAPEVDTQYETLVSNLTECFIPQRNVIHERCVFQSRS